MHPLLAERFQFKPSASRSGVRYVQAECGQFRLSASSSGRVRPSQAESLLVTPFLPCSSASFPSCPTGWVRCRSRSLASPSIVCAVAGATCDALVRHNASTTRMAIKSCLQTCTHKQPCHSYHQSTIARKTTSTLATTLASTVNFTSRCTSSKCVRFVHQQTIYAPFRHTVTRKSPIAKYPHQYRQ